MEGFLNKILGRQEKPKITAADGEQVRANDEAAAYEMGNYDTNVPAADADTMMRRQAEDLKNGPPEDQVK